MGSRPWSVYESDLAVICDLVGDVGELVHYLGRRLAIEDLKVDGRPTDGLELPLAAFRAGKLREFRAEMAAVRASVRCAIGGAFAVVPRAAPSALVHGSLPLVGAIAGKLRPAARAAPGEGVGLSLSHATRTRAAFRSSATRVACSLFMASSSSASAASHSAQKATNSSSPACLLWSASQGGQPWTYSPGRCFPASWSALRTSRRSVQGSR